MLCTLGNLASRRALDVEGIREEFPALQQTIHGEPLIYFDSGATSQKPRRVLDAMAAFYERAPAP